MQLPMVGTWTVVVSAVKPFTIHGDLYYELHVARVEEPERLFAVKVPGHLCGTEIGVGGKLVLGFLMGQVTEVKAERG